MPWPARQRWLHQQALAAAAARAAEPPGEAAPRVRKRRTRPEVRRSPRKHEQVLAYLSDERIRETLTPRQVCTDLGMSPGAVVKALSRGGRSDLAGPYNELRNADLKAARRSGREDLVRDERKRNA